MFRKTALFAAFFLLFMLGGILLVRCYSPGGDGAEHFPENSRRLDYAGEGKTRVTLYFRNKKHDQVHDSPALIEVTRTVNKTEAIARATVVELIRGPLPEELARYELAPVLSEDAVLDDIYIRSSICIVHLACEGTLLPVDEPSPPHQAEQVMVEALVRSLASLPDVRAVWIFQNGSPWQGSTTGWCAPFSLPGEGLGYRLYFVQGGPGDNVIPGPLVPVTVEIESPPGIAAADGPFHRIIELLAQDYDHEHLAPLPAGCRALGFSLKEGLLRIDLTGERPAGYNAAMAAARALVYTFTGLPEIDAVLVTLDGETWESDYFTWNYPLRRGDLN